ncbi:hypothetical protein E2C01_093221 [Portunus trituberculatus]|uniref:Uncharacterized protein n=1 Tax=Portunus trituberculatus TaxID=210409 RepID=A0A5B7JTX8_PORTR|nr:hypothetical protein [Portunus trituberculatus]
MPQAHKLTGHQHNNGAEFLGLGENHRVIALTGDPSVSRHPAAQGDHSSPTPTKFRHPLLPSRLSSISLSLHVTLLNTPSSLCYFPRHQSSLMECPQIQLSPMRISLTSP